MVHQDILDQYNTDARNLQKEDILHEHMLESGSLKPD